MKHLHPVPCTLETVMPHTKKLSQANKLLYVALGHVMRFNKLFPGE